MCGSPDLPSTEPRRVLIVGCGYVGKPLAEILVSQGHQVFGLTRSAEGTAGLECAGIRPLIADITNPAELERLPRDFHWVINLVATSGGGPDAYRAVYLQGTRNLLAWLKPPEKFLYTSSTSVYGQTDGSTVDEASATEPEAETAKVLVQTESLLRRAFDQAAFPALILRVAAIYGPGRGYWFKQFLSGEPAIEGGGERWLNMIHREDLVRIILTALEKGTAGQIYNAVDNEPVQQKDFLEWLAKTLRKPMLRAIEQRTGLARKRGITNKRVANTKIKNELGYHFIYPTFRQGYKKEIDRLQLIGKDG